MKENKLINRNMKMCRKVEMNVGRKYEIESRNKQQNSDIH